jgi:hypothetical protein
VTNRAGWASIAAELSPAVTQPAHPSTASGTRVGVPVLNKSTPGAVAAAAGGDAPVAAGGSGGWPVTLHLLGYLLNPVEEAFVAERRRLREFRLARGRQIVELL